MTLRIDGKEIAAKEGQSLAHLVGLLGLDSEIFAEMPLAAKIAGEVFNLNYIPVRRSEENSERSSVRRAMAASGGEVSLLRYSDPAGRDVYARTAQFGIFLALYRLYPKARAKMNCTVGKSLYIEISDPSFSAATLKRELQDLVSKNIPLNRRRISLKDAQMRYAERGWSDKAGLLSWRNVAYFDEYYFEDFSDYYYGELAPNLGCLRVWDIMPAEGGFVFLFPDDNPPYSLSCHEEMPKFLKVNTEGERWCELMGCETVADLNRLVQSGGIREMVRINEALHEKRYAQVADMICARDAKVVMLAGPSSSGKTTSANRLATQLRILGKQPILMSLDDYYVDRDMIAPEPDGTLDLEHIKTIDTELFKEQLKKLMNGEIVSLPSFNFKTGKREMRGHELQMGVSTIFIVEGLHALNPILLPADVDRKMVFRLYVSPLLPLNLDDHNRIPTSMLRILRRTVRDYETRGATVQKTMSMWDSVRRGEKRWIFPFQEDADVIFNSSTLYELAVLKKHIYPLLLDVPPEDACYETVRGIVKILNYILEADIDDEIPPTSLVREFIGGNTFYR